jgi:hypothetical protein
MASTAASISDVRLTQLLADAFEETASSSSTTLSSSSSSSSLVSITSVRQRLVQALWAGYGVVLHVTATVKVGDKDAEDVSVMVKNVCPPAVTARSTEKRTTKRGNVIPAVSDIGHARKMHSYGVETRFYQHLVPRALAAGCVVPRPLLASCKGDVDGGGRASGSDDGGNGGGDNDALALLMLSDLRQSHPHRRHNFNEKQTKACLDWLARFHATFWMFGGADVDDKEGDDDNDDDDADDDGNDDNGHGDDAATRAAHLWRSACFWHFATRLDEFGAMDRTDPLAAALHSKARVIDALLAGVPLAAANAAGFDDAPPPPGAGIAGGAGDDDDDGGGGSDYSELPRDARFRTLCHGDFKCENILFDDDDATVAAYDFQYIGGGYGAKDLAYLFVCSCAAGVVDTAAAEKSLLQYYHTQLLAALRERTSTMAPRVRRCAEKAFEAFTSAELQRQFDVALLDLIRFQLGWSCWGNTRWAARRCREILKSPMFGMRVEK